MKCYLFCLLVEAILKCKYWKSSSILFSSSVVVSLFPHCLIHSLFLARHCLILAVKNKPSRMPLTWDWDRIKTTVLIVVLLLGIVPYLWTVGSFLAIIRLIDLLAVIILDTKQITNIIRFLTFIGAYNPLQVRFRFRSIPFIFPRVTVFPVTISRYPEFRDTVDLDHLPLL